MPQTPPSSPGTSDTAESPIKTLQGELGVGWSHIEEADRAATEKRSALTATLDGLSLSADTGLLVLVLWREVS